MDSLQTMYKLALTRNGPSSWVSLYLVLYGSRARLRLGDIYSLDQVSAMHAQEQPCLASSRRIIRFVSWVFIFGYRAPHLPFSTSRRTEGTLPIVQCVLA